MTEKKAFSFLEFQNILIYLKIFQFVLKCKHILIHF